MHQINITPQHVASKKQVGRSGKRKVFEIKTTGGLNIIASAGEGGGDVRFLGVGSHRCIARHIAKKNDDDLEWTELSKSDWLELSDYEHLLPFYEELTQEFAEAQGG